MKKFIFLILIVSFCLPAILYAADPIIGTWKLVNPTLDVTDTFREVEGDMIEFSSIAIFEDGTSSSIKSTWPKEGGIFKHLSGGFPEDQLYVEIFDEPGQWYRYVMKDGRQVSMLYKTVSEDGKTLTMISKGVHPGGREMDIKIVYKRDGTEKISGKEDSSISKNSSTKIEGHGNRFTKNEDGTLTDKLSGRRIERYIDNGDGTITDRFAGLMLLNSPLRTIKNYFDAEREIERLNMNKFMGYSDWRLPTATEWYSGIMDKTRAESPTLPQGHPFKNVNTFAFFWSRNTFRHDPDRKWVADLSRGKITSQFKGESSFVWPVRAVDIDF